MKQLEHRHILEALGELSRRLGERGVRGEVCLFGGAAMILAFQTRQATKDIDAIFAPVSLVRELAEEIGRERDFQEGWFNDGVKGFVSERHDTTAVGLPQFEFLQITMPVPEYLFAMKCMAARVDIAGSQDVADARFLARRMGLKRAEEALRIVETYYPAERILPRTQYFIESLFEELEKQP
ncbi:MAG: hypothetical protein HY343_07155 [Lentisphaerae bacterium]|nr:hypothetical protein [Lentisphaerota bacterium]